VQTDALETPQFLARNRKYAVLIAFIVAAILTPTPDMFNQTLMAAPILVDLRNVYAKADVASLGFMCVGVGRPQSLANKRLAAAE
jgi:hypothetical protein